jgi:hypothetical protein
MNRKNRKYIWPGKVITKRDLPAFERGGRYIMQEDPVGVWVEVQLKKSFKLISMHKKKIVNASMDAKIHGRIKLNHTSVIGKLNDAATRVWLFDVMTYEGISVVPWRYQLRWSLLRRICDGFDPDVKDILSEVKSWTSGFIGILSRPTDIPINGYVLRDLSANGQTSDPDGLVDHQMYLKC